MVDADRKKDRPDGVALLAQFEMENDVLPDHPVNNTMGGGQHHFFMQPIEGDLVGDRAIQKGVLDIKGKGYVCISGVPVDGTPNLLTSFIAGTIPVIPEWFANLCRDLFLKEKLSPGRFAEMWLRRTLANGPQSSIALEKAANIRKPGSHRGR